MSETAREKSALLSFSGTQPAFEDRPQADREASAFLPVDRTTDPPVADLEEQPLPEEQWVPLIAVADDSLTQRQALSHLLRERGFDVIQAGTGDEVLVQLNLLRVDAVVLDLQMPTTDGFEVLASLQNQTNAPPVLLVTGMRPEAIQENMRRLPHAELPPMLTKPFDVDQLVALLHMVIRERATKRR